MAKKFSKFLLFTTVAGAAAAGVYLYLKQKNEQPAKDSDDFDDDISDFFDNDKKSDSERGYVSLDRGAAAESSEPAEDAAEAASAPQDKSSEEPEADDSEDA